MSRYDELKALLLKRQEDLRQELHGRLQTAQRTGRHRAVVDSDDGEVDPQDDMNLALIQMKHDVSVLVAEALVRLERGQYGDCAECAQPIPFERLSALPFAIRCKQCEETNEGTTRPRTQRIRGLPKLSPDINH
jgi:DnaK suppressor protein